MMLAEINDSREYFIEILIYKGLSYLVMEYAMIYAEPAINKLLFFSL